MTQQTTAQRIARLIFMAIQETRIGDEASISEPIGRHIAAEIDVLTAQRDEARAEVERLRPAAEAWDKSEAYDTILLCQQPDADWGIRLRRAYNIRGAARARARAAKGQA